MNSLPSESPGKLSGLPLPLFFPLDGFPNDSNFDKLLTGPQPNKKSEIELRDCMIHNSDR